MTTRVLVSGATGNIGRQVVAQLAARGMPVRALVHDLSRAVSLEGPGVELVAGDFSKPDELESALEGMATAFVLTPPDPSQVAWQHNLIAAAVRQGVGRLVKISVLGAAEDSPVMMARWHWQTEQELKQSGLEYTILQPHFFLQNLLGFARTIAAEGRFYAPMRSGKIAPVDVRDIAAVAVAALTEPGHTGQTYIVTGPEAISFAQVAERLSTALGRPISYVDVSPEAARGSLQGLGMPEWLVNDYLALYGAFSAGYGEVVTDVVERVSGRPAVGVEQFARDYADAFAPKG